MTIVDELVKIALLGATWVLYVLFVLSFVSMAAMAPLPSAIQSSAAFCRKS